MIINCVGERTQTQRWKVAVIDVGSNTIKVLCAENNDQRIKKLGARSIEARLGGDQRVEGNWLEDESRKAAIRAILDLQDFALNCEVEKIEIVATSAVRDASNQDQFLEEVAHEAASPCEFSRKRGGYSYWSRDCSIHIFQTQSAFALWILVEVVLSVSNIKIEM